MIGDRAVLRRSPPDILLTNYKMLDMMLLAARTPRCSPAPMNPCATWYGDVRSKIVSSHPRRPSLWMKPVTRPAVGLSANPEARAEPTCRLGADLLQAKVDPELVLESLQFARGEQAPAVSASGLGHRLRCGDVGI